MNWFFESKRFPWRLGVLAVSFCFASVLHAQNAKAVPTSANTPTPSSSFTPNANPMTPTLTATSTLTATPPPTATSTFTFTVTVTPTGTLSPSMTPTPTHTPTISPTPTGTPTITDTPTNSPTGTLSPSLTPTPSNTPTLTVTKTATRTPTATMTATSTPGVFKFEVSPKPDDNGEIHFKWGTTISARDAYLKVYTSGFRLVWEEDFSKQEKSEYLDVGTHERTWNGKDPEGRPMPPGSYICFISISAGKRSYEASGKTEIP